MKYPIEVNEVKIVDPYGSGPIKDTNLFGDKRGSWVSVRPCDKRYKNETYLGILIGYASADQFVNYIPETKVLEIVHRTPNPVIWVPKLNTTIMGYESWWGIIKDENALREITDETIDSQWYVQALKSFEEKQNV